MSTDPTKTEAYKTLKHWACQQESGDPCQDERKKLVREFLERLEQYQAANQKLSQPGGKSRSPLVTEEMEKDALQKYDALLEFYGDYRCTSASVVSRKIKVRESRNLGSVKTGQSVNKIPKSRFARRPIGDFVETKKTAGGFMEALILLVMRENDASMKALRRKFDSQARQNLQTLHNEICEKMDKLDTSAAFSDLSNPLFKVPLSNPLSETQKIFLSQFRELYRKRLSSKMSRSFGNLNEIFEQKSGDTLPLVTENQIQRIYEIYGDVLDYYNLSNLSKKAWRVDEFSKNMDHLIACISREKCMLTAWLKKHSYGAYTPKDETSQGIRLYRLRAARAEDGYSKASKGAKRNAPERKQRKPANVRNAKQAQKIVAKDLVGGPCRKKVTLPQSRETSLKPDASTLRKYDTAWMFSKPRKKPLKNRYGAAVQTRSNAQFPCEGPSIRRTQRFGQYVLDCIPEESEISGQPLKEKRAGVKKAWNGMDIPRNKNGQRKVLTPMTNGWKNGRDAAIQAHRRAKFH